MPLILRALKWWDGKFPKRPEKQKPITPDILKALLSTLADVCWPSYEACLFLCAFSLAFFGAFQVGKVQEGGWRPLPDTGGSDTTPKGTGYYPQVVKNGPVSQRDIHYLEKAV
ncbi:hypothetical protein JRQ81_019481 [Phrynocephalus forsythii]|uniref:Uncharacterized protein n=1 Tax=Phrynocephalus forsythii TaxID=171643 RepID=A0A9Q1AYU0_9SAUR|nr:hypothetical protein JRQ81_019481 [Phrynocephalus forsythii]